MNQDCENVLKADYTGRNTEGCYTGLREIMPPKNWHLQEEMKSTGMLNVWVSVKTIYVLC